jgi:hypothetical protein
LPVERGERVIGAGDDLTQQGPVDFAVDHHGFEIEQRGRRCDARRDRGTALAHPRVR